MYINMNALCYVYIKILNSIEKQGLSQHPETGWAGE